MVFLVKFVGSKTIRPPPPKPSCASAVEQHTVSQRTAVQKERAIVHLLGLHCVMLPVYCCLLLFPPAGLGVAAPLPQPARRPVLTVLLHAGHHLSEVLAPAHARETERRPPQ